MTDPVTGVADIERIRWLLYDSGLTRSYISKQVGITESTLSRVASGERSILKLQLGYALKLTNYAIRIQHPNDK